MSFPNTSASNNDERPSSLHEREQKQVAKHTLLASAANQNYQRCYRALKSLEKYWSGVHYILTVLDQKAKGVGDPLLYTREEMESALEAPRPEPSFTSPGWRRKLSWGTYLTAQDMEVDAAKVSAVIRKRAKTPIPGSPMNPSQGKLRLSMEKATAYSETAIGWSLTGTMNSPSTNVAVMYTSENNARETKSLQPSLGRPTNNQSSVHARSGKTASFEVSPGLTSPGSFQTFPANTMPPPSLSAAPTQDPVLVSDADLLLNFHSPLSATSPTPNHLPPLQPTSFARSSPLDAGHAQQPPPAPSQSHNNSSSTYQTYDTSADHNFGDMVIDSQEIDSTSLLSGDWMPWNLGLEYFPEGMNFGDGLFDLGGGQGGEER
jgi:hypothetical protein